MRREKRMSPRGWRYALGSLWGLVGLLQGLARAEDFLFPEAKFFISGYGSTGFVSRSGEPSTFASSVVPIFHMTLGDRAHFMIEPEIGLKGNEVEFELEIGQIDFIINDYITLVVGKFLLPFNAFSERLHPTWINKMPSLPIIYGHHEEGGIVPVLSDVGAQLRGGVALPWAEGSKVNWALYVVNGPRVARAMEEREEGEMELEFGENFTDVDSNKTVGGRLGVLPVWNMEVGASVMGGKADGDVSFTLVGLDGEYHLRGLELRAEFIRINIENHESIDGFYVQMSYKFSKVEPVVRYGRVSRPEGDVSQAAVGVVYWVRPSLPLKVAYEFNVNGMADRFLVQLAFGL